MLPKAAIECSAGRDACSVGDLDAELQAFINLSAADKTREGVWSLFAETFVADGRVDARVFAAAVDRVATISSEKSRAIKISLAPGHVVLSANAPEAGSATEELEAKYDGALLDVGDDGLNPFDEGVEDRRCLADFVIMVDAQTAGEIAFALGNLGKVVA